MEQETPEEAKIVNFFCSGFPLLLWNLCPLFWMSKTVSCCLAIIRSQCFQGFILPLPSSSFPSVTQLLSLMSSFDLQFSNESFISCSGHLFDLIFTGDLCSFPLSLISQSKFLWSVVVGAHLCRLSLPVMTLTSLLSDLPNTWCLLHSFLTCFPSLRSFHFLLLFNLHWYVSWNTASTPSPLFLSSSSSFASSPCCFLAMVFHFQFSRDCKCSPFWQRSWATFLSISLV